MEFELYPKEIAEYIKNKQTFIPQKISNTEKLRLFHRYWSIYHGEYFKVVDIFIINNIEYYVLKRKEEIYWVVSYPYLYDELYELKMDNYNIKNQDIINSRKSYTGSEIRYWFFMNDIDFSQEYYRGFLPFINPSSKSVISDTKFYRVYRKREGNEYKCYMSMDRSKYTRGGFQNV